jgi:hypothetical protein
MRTAPTPGLSAGVDARNTAHAAPPPDRVLALTRAAQFRHDSIAIPTLRSVVATEDMQVDATGAATDFTPANRADTG